MHKIEVCVGSSCFVKGSQLIVEYLQNWIAKNELQNTVELSAAFCLGNCSNGIAIRINDKIHHIENAQEVQQLLDGLLNE